MTDKEKIEKALEILRDIHSECILGDKDLNSNELLFLIGQIYGILL